MEKAKKAKLANAKYYFPMAIGAFAAMIFSMSVLRMEVLGMMFGALATISFLAAGRRTDGSYEWGLPILLIVGFIFMGMMTPCTGRSREKARRISCTSNLKQIGLALKQYAMDYDDAFPVGNDTAGLELLRSNDYLTDTAVYTCPSTTTTEAGAGELLVSDYLYNGGHNEAGDPDAILAIDKVENHQNYGNALFLDGHVQGYAGEEWQNVVKQFMDYREAH